jgi:hypothetical protein
MRVTRGRDSVVVAFSVDEALESLGEISDRLEQIADEAWLEHHSVSSDPVAVDGEIVLTMRRGQSRREALRETLAEIKAAAMNRLLDEGFPDEVVARAAEQFREAEERLR